MMFGSGRKIMYLLSSGSLIAVLMMTIGFSSFNTDLRISGDVYVRPDYDVRITDIRFTGTEDQGYEEYSSQYSKNEVKVFPVLPTAESAVTYNIFIKNNTERDYAISDIIMSSDKLTYEIKDYKLNEKLCTNSTCNNGNIDVLELTVKYKDGMYDPDNVDFCAELSFKFEYIYKVSYVNVENSNSLKKHTVGGSDYSEQIYVDDYKKFLIKMNGIKLNESNYNYNNGVLTIYDVSGDVVITITDDKVFNLSDIAPDTAFNLGTANFDVFSHTLYAEVELPSLQEARLLENILSFGTDINYYGVVNTNNCGRIHVYYPSTLSNANIQFDLIKVTTGSSWIKLNTDLNLIGNRNNVLKLAFNSNGLYANGKKVFNANGIGDEVTSNKNTYISFLEDFFTTWANQSDITIGSLEGATRSNAKYNDVRIYNNLMTTDELIEITTIENDYNPEEYVYTEMLNESYSPNGEKFYFKTPTFTSLEEKTVFLELNVSDMTDDALQDIFSFGDKITEWSNNSAINLHMYYTKSSSQLTIGIIKGGKHKQFRKVLSLKDNKIKIALGKKGLYINGILILNAEKLGTNVSQLNSTSSDSVETFLGDFFGLITATNFPASMGSQEGTSRSTATYTSLKVYDEVLDEFDLNKITE